MAHKVLGSVLAAMNKNQEALTHLQKAADLLSKDSEVCNNLGAVYKKLLMFPQAEASYRRAIEIAPNGPSAFSNLGNLFREMDRLEEARHYGQKAVELNPEYFSGNLNLGMIYRDSGYLEAAQKYTSKALQLRPGSSKAANNLGSILGELGNAAEAKKYFYKAIELKPDYTEVYANIAELCEKENALDEFRQILERAKLNCTDNTSLILHEARLFRREKKFDHARDFLEKIKTEHMSHPLASSVLNLLAKTYDELGQFDKAFETFQKDSVVKRKIFSLEQCNKDHYLTKLDTQKFPERYDNPPFVPVFLVGYPRSGTTLLDTILRSHPSITVVEEKPMVETMLSGADYFEELAKHIDMAEIKGFLLDKLPLNLVNVQKIQSCFPEAKFILALRHPCDCVLSCFMQSFAPNNAMANMLNLNDAAFLYDKAMTIWKESGVEGHIVKYEDVVDDLEGTIKPLLDYLGLEWSEEITNYAETARKRGRINTPSYHQVVRPLYKTSVGRWNNYQKHMEPVLPILLPWAEYWGYEKLKQRSNKKMPEITIDGKKYDTDKLSTETKNQLISIQFVDKKLQEVQLEKAAYQTARNAYAKALSDILQKEQGQN